MLALRSGLGLGWMFVIAAEFMGASEGLGYLLIDGQQLGKPAEIVAAISLPCRSRQNHGLDCRCCRSAFPALGRSLLASGRGLMLVLENLGKTYPNGVRAVEGINFAVDPGEIVAVIGGSGCGKSTLLRAISGLDRPTHGRVLLDGETITSPHEKIGIVFQEPRLLPWLTVADNVAFGLNDLPVSRRRHRAAGALARVGLIDKRNVWPRELSGGQAQRVAIARALVPQPEVLLLDEPFSALDAFTRVDLQDHLLDLWTDLRPMMILVTHDVDEAIALADRIIVMRSRPGRIFEEIAADLRRPRDRHSAAFDHVKSRVLNALDRSLVGERAGKGRDRTSRSRRSHVVVTALVLRRIEPVGSPVARKEKYMDAGELRAMQAPIKERYKSDPKTAYITLKAKGTLDDGGIACKVETGRALAVAGLHPATGGSGLEPLRRHAPGGSRCVRRCHAEGSGHCARYSP